MDQSLRGRLGLVGMVIASVGAAMGDTLSDRAGLDNVFVFVVSQKGGISNMVQLVRNCQQ